MKLRYYPETDTLYIDLIDKPSTESEEIAEGVIVDFGADEQVVGITIDFASQKIDLKTLEITNNLPIPILTKQKVELT